VGLKLGLMPHPTSGSNEDIDEWTADLAKKHGPAQIGILKGYTVAALDSSDALDRLRRACRNEIECVGDSEI
jgi:hypothetical protein